MDTATAAKIVSLLNRILQKQTAAANDTEANQKLDQILEFLRDEAQAREPRHLTEAQRQVLIATLSSAPNQVVSILRTTRSFELDTFADELSYLHRNLAKPLLQHGTSVHEGRRILRQFFFVQAGSLHLQLVKQDRWGGNAVRDIEQHVVHIDIIPCSNQIAA